MGIHFVQFNRWYKVCSPYRQLTDTNKSDVLPAREQRACMESIGARPGLHTGLRDHHVPGEQETPKTLPAVDLAFRLPFVQRLLNIGRNAVFGIHTLAGWGGWKLQMRWMGTARCSWSASFVPISLLQRWQGNRCSCLWKVLTCRLSSRPRPDWCHPRHCRARCRRRRGRRWTVSVRRSCHHCLCRNHRRSPALSAAPPPAWRFGTAPEPPVRRAVWDVTGPDFLGSPLPTMRASSSRR